MRRVLVVACVILAVFGIPWLVNGLLGNGDPPVAPARDAENPLAEIQRAADLMPAGQLPKAGAPENPAAGKVVPVALQPAQGLPVQTAPSLPANEQELVAAIQKELTRLGYYDGPPEGRWNKSLRYAARQFIRQTGSHNRYGQPTIELLTELQAVNAVTPRDGLRRNTQLRPEAAPKNSPDPAHPPAPEAAAPDQDYLPPWMTPKAHAGQAAANSGVSTAQPEVASGTGAVSYRAQHRRHALRARQSWHRRREAFFSPF